MTLFAVLAILMVIASYLFVLILAAACVYLPYLALDSGTPGFQMIALFLFGIVIAVTMLWSLVPRRDKFVAPGMPIFRLDQGRLFAELDDIAASLNERLPGDVYLIPDANAFVADRGGVMGFGSRRVMGLGLPLFAVLTVSQFRAVLAHEFAHYYGGDTSLGPWVYRTKMAIVRIFQNVGSLGQLAHCDSGGYVSRRFFNSEGILQTFSSRHQSDFAPAGVSRRRAGMPRCRASAPDRRPARHSRRGLGLAVLLAE